MRLISPCQRRHLGFPSPHALRESFPDHNFSRCRTPKRLHWHSHGHSMPLRVPPLCRHDYMLHSVPVTQAISTPCFTCCSSNTPCVRPSTFMLLLAAHAAHCVSTLAQHPNALYRDPFRTLYVCECQPGVTFSNVRRICRFFGQISEVGITSFTLVSIVCSATLGYPIYASESEPHRALVTFLP